MNANIMKKKCLKENQCLFKDAFGIFLNICYTYKVRSDYMNDLFIIDNYVDEREFRNYITIYWEKILIK